MVDAAAATTAALPVESRPPAWRPNDGLGKALGALHFAKKSAGVNLSDTCVLALGERRFLVVVSDEGQQFGVVRLGTEMQGTLYDLGELAGHSVEALLPEPGKKVEVDLEAVASDGTKLFLVGSASLKRKKPKDDSGADELAEVVPASGRGKYFSDYVYGLEASLRGDGFLDFKLVSARDVRQILLGLPLLAPFRDIPSKDNGIDLEGAVAHAGFFFVGLRGPVLRGRALIARLGSDLSEPTLFALDLAGLGVRALTYVDGSEAVRGIYILAGPTMPTNTEHSLYRWTGHDAATEKESAKPLLIGTVPAIEGAHPEALFPLGQSLCAVSDGLLGGKPACRTLP
jgi:hypothetical protein